MRRGALGSTTGRAHNSRVPTPHRFESLGLGDGMLIAVLMWRWVFAGEPHRLIDAATVLTLLIGFLGAADAVFRGLQRRHADIAQDGERPDDLMLFSAEGAGAAATATQDSPPPAARPLWMIWLPNLVYGTVMIAVMWQWAVLGEPFTGSLVLSRCPS